MIMNALAYIVLDFLEAPSMQISVWIWELRMISKFGFDWSYKDSWKRF